MRRNWLIKNGTILTVDQNNRVIEGDLYIENDRISGIFEKGHQPFGLDAELIDAQGCYVLPGLVQAHIHLAQVLFRGMAEDLELLDWLHKKILPLESVHTKESLFASSLLGLAELLLSGTTSCLDMGTVHHTSAIFAAGRELGFRLTSGKAMMDQGEKVSSALLQNTRQSLSEASSLAKEWHGQDKGRLRYAFAPRFILTCSDELMRGAVMEARRLGCLLHTHASENINEVEAVKKQTSMSNIVALQQLGFAGKDVVLAHCVHTSDEERDILQKTGTHVAHCPSTNLKLASGIADIETLKRRGINVGIGADGAPCNNSLDGFREMHLASLLQKINYGAAAMTPSEVLRMATINGAQLLGIEEDVGSLELGKKADVIIVEGAKAHLHPRADPATTLVHAAKGSDVRDVFIDGRIMVRNGKLANWELLSIIENANHQKILLKKRL